MDPYLDACVVFGIVFRHRGVSVFRAGVGVSGFLCRPIGPQLSRTLSSPRNITAHRQHPSRTRRQSRACPACVRARLEAIHFIPMQGGRLLLTYGNLQTLNLHGINNNHH